MPDNRKRYEHFPIGESGTLRGFVSYVQPGTLVLYVREGVVDAHLAAGVAVHVETELVRRGHALGLTVDPRYVRPGRFFGTDLAHPFHGGSGEAMFIYDLCFVGPRGVVELRERLLSEVVDYIKQRGDRLLSDVACERAESSLH